MGFIIILFVVIVGGCYAFFSWIGSLLFPDRSEKIIDKSVHHHYYDNRSVNINKDNEYTKALHKDVSRK